MKKTTKTTKPPAPAAKSTAPAPARKSSIAPAPAPKPVAIPKIKKPLASASAAPVKASAIVITANVDVGFGNTLFIRGEGAGLNWDHGLPLACLADNEWSITLAGATKPVSFKLLVNDEKWSEGVDAFAAPGETIVLSPAF